MSPNRQFTAENDVIVALLDRLDPTPRLACGVPGCIHLHHEPVTAETIGTV